MKALLFIGLFLVGLHFATNIASAIDTVVAKPLTEKIEGK